ncbi:MAG TPA: hypothetical protein HPP77_11665 [Candidatus Hydrogenedentes bacterium]|nr:hypothetical protein [Candidatus Hydrogenedentota bacterium]HIJ72491.1 hypothetical protein [Candidatus Hydrogenedentota bacterium]
MSRKAPVAIFLNLCTLVLFLPATLCGHFTHTCREDTRRVTHSLASREEARHGLEPAALAADGVTRSRAIAEVKHAVGYCSACKFYSANNALGNRAQDVPSTWQAAREDMPCDIVFRANFLLAARPTRAPPAAAL